MSNQINKICVFCGEKPVNKNKEHIIPQWLIESTGNPKRVVSFGFNNKTESTISFSWTSFTVPACTICNGEFSELEGQIRPIFDKLYERSEINFTEAQLLLDWLDKVRIGLWLNYYFIEKNKGAIILHMSIKKRVAMKDRIMQIHFLSSESQQNGINAFGVESLVFQYNPSFFALRSKNLLIINGSNDFLISKNCGFPYPQSLQSRQDGKLDLDNLVYDRSTSTGVIDMNLYKAPLTIYQPIQTNISYGSNLFKDSYLIQNTLPNEHQKGTLFRIKNGKLMPLQNENEILKYESVSDSDIKMIGPLIAQVYDLQNRCLERLIDIESHKSMKLAVEINDDYIDFYTKYS